MKQFTPDQFVGELRRLARIFNTPSVNQRLARKCIEIVYRRVKAGYGVDSDKKKAQNTKQVKLKALSESYIQMRLGKVQFFRAKDGHVYAIKNEEIAASVVAKKVTKGRGKLKIGAQTKIKFKKTSFHNTVLAPVLGPYGRPKKSNATFTGEMMEEIYMQATAEGFRLYVKNSKRKDESGLTNKQVMEYYSKDRPFFALTAGELRILSRELEKIVSEFIEKNL